MILNTLNNILKPLDDIAESISAFTSQIKQETAIWKEEQDKINSPKIVELIKNKRERESKVPEDILDEYRKIIK
jgi:hypothetical protein